MARQASTVNRIIDIANALPLPRELLAYPVDLIVMLCGDAPATFCVPVREGGLGRVPTDEGRDTVSMRRLACPF